MQNTFALDLGKFSFESRPLWVLADPIDQKNHSLEEKNLLSLSYGNVIKKNIDDPKGLKPESFANYAIVEPGDIVLRMTDLQNDQKSIRTGLVINRGIITSAYVNIRPIEEVVEPRYLHYVLRLYDIKKTFYRMGSGIRQSLNWTELSELPIPVPPLETQRRIADYLDYECAKIDESIALAGQITKKVQEKWQAYLDQIILDIDEPVVSLNKVATFLNGDRSQNYPSKEEIFDEESVPFLSTQVLRDRWDISATQKFVSESIDQRMGGVRVQKGDILYCLRGSVGKCGVNDLYEHAILASSLVVLRPSRSVESKWINYVLKSTSHKNDVATLINGSCAANLSADILSRCQIPLPDKAIQCGIIKKLDEEFELLEKYIDMNERIILLLHERKQALISAVVTGQKEV